MICDTIEHDELDDLSIIIMKNWFQTKIKRIENETKQNRKTQNNVT